MATTKLLIASEIPMLNACWPKNYLIKVVETEKSLKTRTIVISVYL